MCRVQAPVTAEALVPPIPLATLVIHNPGEGEMTLTRGSDTFLVPAGGILVVAATAPLAARGCGRLMGAWISRDQAGLYTASLRGADGVVITRSSPTARLVGPLLVSLASEGGVHQTRVVDHIVGLIGLMCAEHTVGDARERLLQRAQQYVERHLHDLDLSPQSIARALNVSPRTLQRTFENDGATISSWVRTRRLERCRVELADPTLAGIPVSQIGARWGLWEAAHFSRAFKAAYGLSPSAYRARALGDTQLRSA